MSDHAESQLEERRYENLQSLFEGSHRDAVPIREAFLQIRGTPPAPGRLADLVRGRKHQALDLYLLIHAATASPPHQVYVNPEFWATLVRRPGQSLRNARLALGRGLAQLEKLDLILTVTHLGVPLIQLLNESGNTARYVHPGTENERYIKLPHEFWEMGYDRRLDLAGKATFLIARSLNPTGFTLPLAHAGEWYGLSADTLQRGMSELVRLGVARYQSSAVPSPKAPGAFAIRRTYKLFAPMGDS